MCTYICIHSSVGIPYVVLFNNGVLSALHIITQLFEHSPIPPTNHRGELLKAEAFSGLLTAVCGTALACGQMVTALGAGALLEMLGGEEHVGSLFAVTGQHVISDGTFIHLLK